MVSVLGKSGSVYDERKQWSVRWIRVSYRVLLRRWGRTNAIFASRRTFSFASETNPRSRMRVVREVSISARDRTEPGRPRVITGSPVSVALIIGKIVFYEC